MPTLLVLSFGVVLTSVYGRATLAFSFHCFVVCALGLPSAVCVMSYSKPDSVGYLLVAATLKSCSQQWDASMPLSPPPPPLYDNVRWTHDARWILILTYVVVYSHVVDYSIFEVLKFQRY